MLLLLFFLQELGDLCISSLKSLQEKHQELTQTVLEIGSGSGALTVLLLKRFPEVIHFINHLMLVQEKNVIMFLNWTFCCLQKIKSKSCSVKAVLRVISLKAYINKSRKAS